MKIDIYINPQGETFGVEPSQQNLIKPDWVKCQVKPDGTEFDNYNLDGTPAPDDDPTVEEVKLEAGRRILIVCPEWRQRNHIATDLTYAKIIQAGGSLTAEQEESRVAIESVWASVQNIRSKSNEIEAMSPIPQDYTNDSYWN
jgi:hypothetical protein